MKHSIKQSYCQSAVVAVLVASFSALAAAQVPKAPVTPTEPAKGSVSQISWLTGCWQAKVARDNSTIHETWFSARGGSLMGVGLTYRDDKTLASEAMRMYDEGGTVKLWMRPASRNELTMTLNAMGGGSAEFFVTEGPATTKLRYEKKSATELVATFRVEQGENRRGVDFGFNKIDCAEVFLPEVAEMKAPEKK